MGIPEVRYGMILTLFVKDPIMNIGIFFFLILFAFILFLALVALAAVFRRESEPNYHPAISVVIPCYNEEKHIGPCIRSVLSSDYPGIAELLIVDDSSSDGSLKVVRGIMEEHKCIRILHQQHKGKSAALNLGVKNARSEIVLTLDADTLLDRDCLRRLVAPHKSKVVAATTASCMVRRPVGILQHFQDIEYHYNSLIRVAFTKVFGSGIWFFGAAAAYKRSVLLAAGSFKADTLTEDMDIALELYKRGYKTLTLSKAVCRTDCPSTLAALYNQRSRWWFGVLQALVKNKQILRKGADPSMWFLYVNQFWWSFYSVFSLPMFIYQICYWMPKGGLLEIGRYLFAWFSIIGPLRVLWNLPNWGLSLLNIFGVMAGIISTALIICSLAWFGKKPSLGTAFAVFFYFPYTILLNIIILLSLVTRKKSKFIS